ncbi:MAG: MotA/TolQ/ExbB proton channel family protein [Sphingomicrobium sp.]
MATPAAPAGDNPYGLMQALHEGGIISWTTFIILVIMSVGTFYILFTKLMQQQKIISQGRKVRSSFWNSPNLREASTKLESRSAYRSIVDDALTAQEQHDKLDDPIDRHDWVSNSLARSNGSIMARLGEGLAFLATVGSTAPFVGLFGTVVGIYRALIKLGSSGGTPGIDKVAGPVGEALIMTALGLIVAVPAVLAYNWLVRRNKSIQEDLAAFTNDLNGFVASGGKVKPRLVTAGATAQTKSSGAPTQPGSEPLRTGRTATGAQATPE